MDTPLIRTLRVGPKGVRITGVPLYIFILEGMCGPLYRCLYAKMHAV